MSAEFDALVAEVTETQTVEASAVALIQGIATQLQGNPTPQQVADLSSKLKSSADALAAAITANTPATA